MLISAFAFSGIPKEAVNLAFSQAEIIVSPALLKEYRDVPLALEAEGKLTHIQMKALVSGIAAAVAKARIVKPQRKIFICRDAKDNMLIECCFEAKAHFLITGDQDLLSIPDLPFTVRILTPRKFVEEF